MAGGRPFVCKQERAVAVRKLDPEGARRFAHFSQAVLVEVPGPTLYVAGQGDVTGDFEIQARKAWTQIEVLLNEAGMTLTAWLRSPVMLSIEITFPRIAPFSWK